ncbi:MAG: lamin tail domain-containing protein [Chitinispirillales bacterium]|jgi:hypothetical protein|nr:lamin tail domain-containing protein [Chitinispirillales bacterium]
MRLKTVISAAAAIVAIGSTSTDAIGVAITELHRDPSAGNKTAIPGGYSHSFVEITNFGGDTFFFKNVFLTNGKATDSIMLFGDSVSVLKKYRSKAACLPPGGIAVVLPQNYAPWLSDTSSLAHPMADSTIVLTVNRKTLCGGLANDDGVALYRGTRSQIDSLIGIAADQDVYVSAPLSGKITLSLKQPKGVSVVPASLVLGNGSGNRRYILSPTAPLTPGRYEALLDGMLTEYSAEMFFGTVQCSLAVVFVTGNGQNAAWRFYSHTSGGGAGADEIDRGVFGNQRQYLLTIDIDPKPGNYVFEVTPSGGRAVSVPVDLSSFWAAAGSLLVTEIYPRGSAKADQPEWFELQNVSPAGVNLNEWMFGGPNDTAALAASDLILPSGQFIVVTKDTAAMRSKYPRIPMMIKPARWLALNNHSDTLCVLSPHGVVADMAVYRSAWFGGGWTTQSLERVSGTGNGHDSVSWTLCNNPTPGFPGNAEVWRAVSAPSVEIGPTPFRPNGKRVDGFLSIRLKAPPNCRVKVKILSFDGKLLKTFTDEKELIMWDGKTDNAKPAAPGPIYIVAEFTSAAGGKKVSIRKNGILWR